MLASFGACSPLSSSSWLLDGMSSAHVSLAENDPEFYLYTNIFCIVLSTTIYYQNQILHSILMFQILLLLLDMMMHVTTLARDENGNTRRNSVPDSFLPVQRDFFFLLPWTLTSSISFCLTTMMASTITNNKKRQMTPSIPLHSHLLRDAMHLQLLANDDLTKDSTLICMFCKEVYFSISFIDGIQ